MNNMRLLHGGILLLLIASIVTVFAQDNEDDPNAASREKCRTEAGLSEDELENGKYDLEPMKCFLSCFLQDLGVMDPAGNFDVDAAVNAMSEDLREAGRDGVVKCHEQYQDAGDPCQHAYDLTKCFSEDSPEVYAQLGIFSKPSQM